MEHTNEPKVEVVESTATHQHEMFTIVEHDGEFMIAIGNQIISKEKFNDLKHAKAYIDRKPWEMILNATAVMINKLNEINK